jgi:hypothetical protein
MRNLIVFVFFFLAYQVTAHRDSLKSLYATNTYLEKIAILNQTKTDFIKWKRDIKIFIHPTNHQNIENTEATFSADFSELKKELAIIIDELNQIIEPISFSFVNKIEESNLEILIGSSNDSRKLDPSTRFLIQKNWAIQHCLVSGDGTEIVKSFIFLDLYRIPNLRIKKRLLRKKIVQSIGMFNETDDFKESIFYEGLSEHVNFSSMDLELIRLFYHSN